MMSTCALETYGNLGKLIKSEEYYEPPLIPAPDEPWTNATDPDKFHRTMRIEDEKARRAEIRRMQQDRTNLFAMLWSRMSEESREVVQAVSVPAPFFHSLNVNFEDSFINDWDNVESECDPKRLLERIRRTHIGADTGLLVNDIFDITSRYETIKMDPRESILHLKKRFKDAIDAISAVGGNIETQQMQAARFLRCLKADHRYNPFVVAQEELAAVGLKDLPNSYQEAYELASKYKIRDVVRRHFDTTVFTATQHEDTPPKTIPSRSKVKEHKAKGEKRVPIKVATATGKSQSESRPPPICTICNNGDRHYHRFCPIIKRAATLAKEESSESRSNKAHAHSVSGGLQHSGVVLHAVATTDVQTTLLDEEIPQLVVNDDLEDEQSYHVIHTSLSHSMNKVNIYPDDIVFNGSNIIDAQSEHLVCQDINNAYITTHIGSSYTHENSNPNVCITTKSSLSPEDVILDSGASVSIFRNLNLLSNVQTRSVSVVINGVHAGAEDLVTSTIGSFHDFHGIYYHEAASINIISLSTIMTYCRVTFDTEWSKFVVIAPSGKIYQFLSRSGLFVFSESSQVNVSITERLRLFSPAEQNRAIEAKQLIRALGYPSPRSVISMIRHGLIRNCPVNSRDIVNALEIYGPDLATLRGKTHHRASKVTKFDEIPRLISSRVVLNADIMFVETNAYLITVADPPLGLTMVNDLGLRKGARNVASIRRALLAQIAAYRVNKFSVVAINTDGEGAIFALSNELRDQGIQINQAGAGSHVGTIERKIEEVKERVRGIINTLPFRLTFNMLVFLVLFCVSRINLVPHKANAGLVSPAQLFRDRLVDYRTELQLSFGEYVEATDRTTDNSMRPRTHPCISLLPVGNSTGSWKMLSLNTGKVVTRDHWVVKPFNNLVLEHLNALADANRNNPNVDIDFAMGPRATPVGDREVNEIPEVNMEPLLVRDGVGQPIDSIDSDDDEDQSILEENANTQESDAINHESDNAYDISAPLTTLNAEEPPSLNELQPKTVTWAEDLPIPSHTISRHRYGTRTNLRAPQPLSRKESLQEASDNVRQALSKGASQFSVYNISVKKAMSDMPDKALASIFKEISQMLSKEVWHGVNLNHGGELKPIRSFVFLKEKFNSLGEFEKLKSRLVAGGHMEDKSTLMFDEISSPTASLARFH